MTVIDSCDCAPCGAGCEWCDCRPVDVVPMIELGTGLLPAGPLLGLFPRGPRTVAAAGHVVPGSNQDVARRCGVSHRTVVRWKGGGCVTRHTADRVAVHLGKHPWEIWGDDWWTA